MEGRRSRKTQAAAPFKRTRGAFWPDASHMRQPAPRWETKGQVPWFPNQLLAPAAVPDAQRPQAPARTGRRTSRPLPPAAAPAASPPRRYRLRRLKHRREGAKPALRAPPLAFHRLSPLEPWPASPSGPPGRARQSRASKRPRGVADSRIISRVNGHGSGTGNKLMAGPRFDQRASHVPTVATSRSASAPLAKTPGPDPSAIAPPVRGSRARSPGHHPVHAT